MAISLVYDLRRGQIAARAPRIALHLPTWQDDHRALAWHELARAVGGKYTLWDHCFETPHRHEEKGTRGPILRIERSNSSGARISRDHGSFPARFDGTTRITKNEPHGARGTVVYVGGPTRGTHLHAGPACNYRACLIVVRGWEALFQAITKEKELSLAVRP